MDLGEAEVAVYDVVGMMRAEDLVVASTDHGSRIRFGYTWRLHRISDWEQTAERMHKALPIAKTANLS